MAFIDRKALEAAGFVDTIEPRQNSAVIQISGIEASGKTSWALTGPKPLLYQGTDFGTDGVIQKAKGQILRPRGKDGKPREYKLDIPSELRSFTDRDQSTTERQKRESLLAEYVHENFYKPFHADFLAGINAGVRTVVWDTALEVWENTRLSVYGRNATNRDDLKAEANAKFREMVRLANVHGIVLIMVNHLKPKWVAYVDNNTGATKWKQTDDFEMQGFDKAPFLVTTSLWTKYTPGATGEVGKFELTVKKCRDNPQFVGETFDSAPFEEIMAMLVPSVESWE